ncbi:PTS cellobiose transporter subunit IIC [Xylocopilactobacillus apicola]|uniref:Permease IIC component n=1 Tax=Xylocopilactobacillus apicola TaxID=2932184 RepID=A0AAU9D2T0_9LACO|nr:PTS cellobiose transporter subunit IIC [Xylocopilactobacillus apicola]BDR57763.1 permease IIC component [Xylocopilactobacillus apicola]
MGQKEKSSFLNEKLIPFFNKIAGSRHLIALRDGMTAAVPMIIIGSIFMMIGQFPIKSYQTFMTQTFGANWATIVQYPTNASFHIMGLIAVAGISYNLAKSYKIDAFSSMIVAIGAFILTIPMQIDKKGALWIPLKLLDSSGLFIALIVGLFVTDLYVWLVHKNLTIKMPDTVPPAVSNSFASLFPGAIVLIVVWLVRLGVEATPMKSIPNVITFFLQAPLGHLTNTLGGALVIEFIVSFLWLFGIHGANTLTGITSPMLLAALAENASAQAAGKPLPNIVTKQFFEIFIRIGGCGATLGLALMIAFMSRSKEFKVLGELVVGPAIFNINEPIVFGLPIVLNYKMAIPYILAPLSNVVMTYTSMKFGWVARTFGVMVPWTTPPLLSGYLSTGHISGAVLQLVEIIVDAMIYFFFFKSMDNDKVKEEAAAEAALQA